MENTNKSALGVRQLPLAGLLTALVIVLQLIANYVQPIPGVSITLVLVPIIIGAALLGPMVGAWLGLVFGVVVMAFGGATAFFAVNVPGTVIICLAKGALAGLAVGLVYRALTRINDVLAIVCAAVVCPVVNTGVFLIGCRLFFWPTITEWGQAGGYANAALYAILGLAGINFLIELGINVLLSPAILMLIKVGRKMRS